MAPRTDTSFDARRRQLEAYRSMAPEERLRLAAGMSEDVRSLARAGIVARQAGAIADEAIDAALARILLGDELAAAVAAARVDAQQ